MQTIALIGGGSWATALIKILSNNDVNIHWWLRNADSVEFISKYHHNPNYLSDVELDMQKVKPTSVIKEAVDEASTIILAVPAAFLMSSLSEISSANFENKKVFSAIKGIVPEHNLIVFKIINCNLL